MSIEAVALGQERGHGYYGKVPTHGDFVQRRLPRSFIDPWDSWLQRAIVISREQLAESWLDSYLTSPIWRFTLNAGLCGDQAVAGLLMPSVDSVGRYYPMTIAALLEAPSNPFDVASRGNKWFREAEEVALSCLDEGFLLNGLEDRLANLAPILTEAVNDMPQTYRVPTSANGGIGWILDGLSTEEVCPAIYPAMLDELLRDRLNRYSLWWTSGSDRIPATFKIYEGLPPETEFAAFLSAPES